MDAMGLELQTIREMLLVDFPDLKDGEIRKASMKIIKLRWKKQDNEWHARSGLAATMPIGDFYNLQKIRPELPEKPDLSTQEHYARADFKRYQHQFSLVGNIEIVEEVSLPSLSSIVRGESAPTLKNDKPNDYVLMKSVLCTSLPFVNANGDAFEAGDLVEAVESGQMDKLQPAIVDWRHDFQSCGNTIGAEINDKILEIEGFGKNKVKQITVYSVFYAWLNTYKAKKIRDWAKKGVLTFSMACGAESTEYLNGGAVRVLQKPHFVANSIIPPDLDPADENATLTEMAGKDEDGKDKKVPVVYASYNEYPQTVRENLSLAWADDKIISPNEENKIGVDMDKIKELEATIAQLKKEIEEHKQSEDAKKVAELEGKLEVAEADLVSAQGEKKSLKDELTVAKEEAKVANEALVAAKKEIKEMRKTEVDNINKARKLVLAEIFGEDGDKVNYWYDKYEATIDDDGNIVDDEEGFNEAIASFPEEKELTDEEKAEAEKVAKEAKVKAELEAKLEAIKSEDISESEKVKRSKALTTAATADVPEGTTKKALSKTM
jgi:hypothetical protein